MTRASLLPNLLPKSHSKAQASMEYLIIVSLAVALLAPTVYIFVTGTQRSTDLSIHQQIVQIGQQVVRNIETVDSYGRSAQLIVEFRMPPNVQRVYIINSTDTPSVPGRELVFETVANGRANNMVFFLNTPVFIAATCDGVTSAEFTDRFLATGDKKLRITNCGGEVSLWFN